MDLEKNALTELKLKISRYRRGMKIWQDRLRVTRQTFYGYFKTSRKTRRLEEVSRVGVQVLTELERIV